MQDLIADDSFGNPKIQRADITEGDGVSTPNAAARKEEGSPARAHSTALHNPIPPDIPSSPPNLPSEVGDQTKRRASRRSSEDEIWAFNEMESAINASEGKESARSDSVHVGESPRPVVDSLPLPDLPRRAPSNSISPAKTNIFDWSEQTSSERDSFQNSSPRPKTVHGKNGKEMRGSRMSSRRGPSPLHLRSQSVPVPSDGNGHRGNSTTAKLESWVLGNKGVSEDWDNDFDFEEPTRPNKQVGVSMSKQN